MIMKKFLFIIAIFGMLASTTVSAQDKSLSKALQKEMKAKKKDFKKKGFELFGTSRTIDVVLLKYYTALEEGGDDVMEMVGYASAKSKGLLVTAAENNARQRYATMVNAQVKGQIKTNPIANSSNFNEEIDKFEAIFLTKVESELKGVLKPSFSVIKTDPVTGVSELETYFIINEAAAGKARVAAAESAAREASINAAAAEALKEAAKARVSTQE